MKRLNRVELEKISKETPPIKQILLFDENGEPEHTAVIHLEGKQNGMIITSFEAYLLNDHGQTIERLN